MFQYEARVLRIVDGDTLWLDLDLGFKIRHEVDVRLAGVNTPETVNYTAQGIDDPAARFVAERVPPGSVCIVDITRREKYGRWLARVLFVPGEVDRVKILQAPRVLNDELIAAGLAKAYNGGRR